MRLVTILCILSITAASPAASHPDGAPWGSADPDSAGNCTSCHFGGEAVYDSDALSLQGLPGHVSPGETYDLILYFTNFDARAGGFSAKASAGSFVEEDNWMEVRENEVRSIKPLKGEGVDVWLFKWTVPASPVDSVSVEIAANAANNDASPFGDVIHFKTIYNKQD